ncbi:MAG: caspase family protein, partial [Chloracidobacterium sp.]|nr:caspase family protein [Chloracidobacterium sp.]
MNDAVDMAEVLAGYGFEVIKAVDVGREGLYQQIRAFGRRLRAGSGSEARVVGLFYYAGHGIQVEGRNYLVPVGAERQMREEEDVGVYCVEVGEVLKQMGEGGSQVNIVILDACRDNPYARSWRRSGVDGLAEMSAPKGTLMAYATDPGKTAKDVGEGRNGLYTGVLLKWLRAAPEQDVRRLLDEVGKEVERKSGGKQQPWVASKLRDAFCFRPAEVAVGGGEKPVETPVGLEVEREVPRGTVVVRVGEIG